MKINSLELVQSYIFTTAKYDFSVYEKRIMYCIVKLLQAELEGRKLNEKYSIQNLLWDEKNITIPIADCLTGSEKTYDRIKKAVEDLESKKFIYEDDKQWKIIRIINMPVVEKYSSVIKLRLQPEIVNAFLSFQKGYRKYVFEIAMNFDSIYAMRFYELFSNKFEPITYSIETIKEMFQISDKYKLVADFRRKVLDRAKKELDKKSPFSFNYKMIKTGRKITHILFTPYKIAKNQPADIEQKELNKQISPFWSVSPELTSILIQHFGYDKEIIKNHKKILGLVTKHLNFTELLREIYGQIHNNNAINNVPAYMYGIFRNKLTEKGVYLDANKDNQNIGSPSTEEWEDIQRQLNKIKK